MHTFDSDAGVHVSQYLYFSLGGWVAHRNHHQESIELRLRQRESAVHLDGILGSDDHEGRRDWMSRSVHGDSALLHDFKHGRLGTRGGPINFIGEHEVREYGPRMEFELTPTLMEDRHSRHITGE